MSFVTNPFHTMYLTENVSDVDIPLMFSPVLVPYVTPLYLPGNVVLRGMQGTGKTMLLSLLDTNVRLAFWANENREFRGSQFTTTDPLPVSLRRFVGAGINLSKSNAFKLIEIVASSDSDENYRLTRAYFGDYLNCWVLRDLLASVEKLVTSAPPERQAEVGVCRDASKLRDAISLMGDDSSCSFLRGLTSVAEARLALERRLRAYLNLISNPKKLLPSEIDETRSILGEPLFTASRALRSSGVIAPDVNVIVTIDQFETLVRKSEGGGDNQKHQRFVKLIYELFLSRNPEVSYRIGTRPNAVQAWSDDARDFSEVDLDSILQRTEHGRRTQGPFLQFAEDAFRRRISASDHPFRDEITAARRSIRYVFGSSPSHAERAVMLASKKADRVVRVEESWPVDIRMAVENLAKSDAVAGRLGEAWVRQQLARKAPLDITKWSQVECRPWESKAKQWWKKERLPLAALQVATSNSQRLTYFGEADMLSLAGENILVFIGICKEIWECDARHRAASKIAVSHEAFAPFDRLRQSEGIRDASRLWHEKIAQCPDGDTLQRFVDVIGKRLHGQLIDDRAMSYPGANGISLAMDDLINAPEVERLLDDATAECFLLRRRHTPKSKSRGISAKWYPHPILAPFYGLTVPHTKEPLYLKVETLRRWLEVGGVLASKPETVTASTPTPIKASRKAQGKNPVKAAKMSSQPSAELNPKDKQKRLFGEEE